MKVVLTAAALAELEGIRAYIAADSPRRAASFVDEILDRCLRLGDMPEAYPLVPLYSAQGIRRRVYRSYLIFYRIRDESVEVLHVLHGARD